METGTGRRGVTRDEGARAPAAGTAVTMAGRYLASSTGVAAAGAVYELFSHGVYSYWMLYAFAFPLVGGCAPALLLARMGRPAPDGPTRRLWCACLLTLTVGAMVQGILEIYGTTNRLTALYWAVSAVFGALTALSAVCRRSRDAAPRHAESPGESRRPQ